MRKAGCTDGALQIVGDLEASALAYQEAHALTDDYEVGAERFIPGSSYVDAIRAGMVQFRTRSGDAAGDDRRV